MPVYVASKDPEIQHRVREIMATLVEKFILHEPHGFLGIQYRPSTVAQGGNESLGFEVVMVVEGSPAQKAGLVVGDQLTKIDDFDLTKTARTTALLNFIRSKRPADKVQVTVIRDGQSRVVDVELGEIPPELNPTQDSEVDKESFFDNWLRSEMEKLPHK